MPSNPRSPAESTVTVRKGVGSKAPFLITRNVPRCSQTKMRPSGARAIAVGSVRPAATSESVKPDGTVAPLATRALAIKSNDVRIQRADFIRNLPGLGLGEYSA